MGAKLIRVSLKPVKTAITKNGRVRTANNHIEKAEVLKNITVLSLGKKKTDAVLRSDNNDVEILSITVTKEDVKQLLLISNSIKLPGLGNLEVTVSKDPTKDISRWLMFIINSFQSSGEATGDFENVNIMSILQQDKQNDPDMPVSVT